MGKNKGLANYLKQPQNLPILITIFVLIVSSVLSIFYKGDMYDRITFAIILLALSSIAAYLLNVHYTNMKLDSSISAIQGLLHPGTKDVVFCLGSVIAELRNRFKTSNEIWFLTRTATGWMSICKDELAPMLETQNIKFIVLNPDAKVSKIRFAETKKEWEIKKSFLDWKDNYKSFLTNLSKKPFASGNDSNLKTIDFLPPYTLIFINPNQPTKEPIIYVELSKYHAGSSDRPVFRVTPQDTVLYELFFKEFENICGKAVPFKA